MKLLLIDIENAPNLAHVWSLFGVNVSLDQLQEASYMLSWAAKWIDKKEVMFASIYHDGKDEMLKKLYTLLNEADAVIHYNGERFDIPVINKELLLESYLPPSPFHQVDLYKVVKKRFKFTSNKLDHVAGELGLGKKVAHQGHTLWVKCMSGDSNAWTKMKAYNIQDVKLLEKLYKRILPWIQNHPNMGLFTESDKPVCTNCGCDKLHKHGIETTLTFSYQRYRCTKCGTPLRGRYTLNGANKKNILTQSKL